MRVSTLAASLGDMPIAVTSEIPMLAAGSQTEPGLLGETEIGSDGPAEIPDYPHDVGRAPVARVEGKYVPDWDVEPPRAERALPHPRPPRWVQR